MNFALGVTLGNLTDITALGLPEPLYEPLSDFIPYSATRQRMDGLVVGTGKAAFTWRFPELTIGQYGTLLYFLTVGGVLQASNLVWVRTRIITASMADRIFANFTAIMLLPFEPDDARYDTNRLYQDMEVKFIHATRL